MFDGVARRYGLTNTVLSGGLDRGWRKATGAALALGPRDTVLDLAAGTGKLTRSLAARDLDVVAIEPVAEMRAVIAGAGIAALDGTAEAIPLADASADAVTVAQAFHWFDGPRALAEIHRVLRSGGVLAVVYNVRCMDDPIQRRIRELLEPHRGDVPAGAAGDWRAALAASEHFEPVAARTFDNAQVVDADALADRVGSVSFVAAMDDEPRNELLAAARELAGDGTVTLPHRTEVEILRRRD